MGGWSMIVLQKIIFVYHADHACVRTFQVNNISYTSFNLYEATKNDKTCFYLCTTLSLCKPTQKLFV